MHEQAAPVVRVRLAPDHVGFFKTIKDDGHASRRQPRQLGKPSRRHVQVEPTVAYYLGNVGRPKLRRRYCEGPGRPDHILPGYY